MFRHPRVGRTPEPAGRFRVATSRRWDPAVRAWKHVRVTACPN